MPKILRFSLILCLFLVVSTGIGAIGLWFYLLPKLPPIDVLKDVRFQVPLRVYARDGALIAEFGEKRRVPVKLSEVPKQMIQAVLAAEDDRFYQHPGVDWQGLLRAAIHLAKTGEKGQGGSTVTMQVARNFFLSREKTYLRKLNEILLAIKIERVLSKDDILELYLNKIYLGHRAYGVAAAAQVYYGVKIQNLGLAQLAMIAGLPKAPSRFNPVVNPDRATDRRNYVLGRMRTLGMIDEDTYQQAIEAPVTARLHGQAIEVEAPYIAEMVRDYMTENFGNEAYIAGYRVFTTSDSRLQNVANRALRNALLQYEQRHGYRGPEGYVPITDDINPEQWRKALQGVPIVGALVPALVVEIDGQSAKVFSSNHGVIDLHWEGLAWARPYIDENHRGPAPQVASDILKVGDRIRIYLGSDERWGMQSGGR